MGLRNILELFLPAGEQRLYTPKTLLTLLSLPPFNTPLDRATVLDRHQLPLLMQKPQDLSRPGGKISAFNHW